MEYSKNLDDISHYLNKRYETMGDFIIDHINICKWKNFEYVKSNSYTKETKNYDLSIILLIIHYVIIASNI